MLCHVHMTCFIKNDILDSVFEVCIVMLCNVSTKKIEEMMMTRGALDSN